MACSTTAPVRGFTLVEVLVALFVMSLLAVMAWQGVDGMVRARDASQQRLERALRLNTVLAQWQQDLGSLQDDRVIPSGLSFNGASLQLTRRTPTGLQLVVWSLRGGRWLRWAGPSVTTRAELQESWLRSQQLQGTETAQVVTLGGLTEWQMYCFRGNAWSNCQSSGDVAPAGAAASAAGREALPSGVRLVLGFGEGSGYNGSLTRDTLLLVQTP